MPSLPQAESTSSLALRSLVGSRCGIDTAHLYPPARAACRRASWPLDSLSQEPTEWQSPEVASESTNASLAWYETARRGQTHLLRGDMAWAWVRTLAATAGPMEPPEHTSEPKWTYDRSRCTTQSAPGMAIALPCSRYSSRLADLDKAPRTSVSAADLPRPQWTTMPRLNNTSATMAPALRTAEATPMLLRSTQQKQESSA